ncbi:MAG: class I SAM-dependent methyltransferase [Acidimicrobiia bacterium]
MSDTTSQISGSDYFGDNYRDYERQNPPRKLDHYLDVIEASIDVERGELLDLGCGLGAFLGRAAERLPDWKLSGTDINLSAVDMTRARVPRADVRLAGADASSHPPGSFDVITAWDVIEHVQDLDQVASSVLDMLRPGGIFVFVVPVYDGPLGKLVRLMDKDPTHLHKLDRSSWVDWASTTFEVRRWHGIFRYLVGGRWYAHFPTKSLRRESSAILVVAGKTR